MRNMPLRPVAPDGGLEAVDVRPFDYTALDPEAARALAAGAARVRDLGRKSVEFLIEIGRELIAAKAKLGHGLFLSWLAAECRLSERSARRFMLAAQWAEGKSANVTDLDPTAVYLLPAPSTPRQVQIEILQRLDHGQHPTVDEICERIRTVKARPDRTQRPGAVDREERRREAEQHRKDRARQTEEFAAALDEIVSLLRERLGPSDLEQVVALTTIIEKNANCKVRTAHIFARLREATVRPSVRE